MIVLTTKNPRITGRGGAAAGKQIAGRDCFLCRHGNVRMLHPGSGTVNSLRGSLASALLRWCVLLATVFPVDLSAAPSGGAPPAINEPFIDGEFAQWVERFERPGREVYDQRHRIVAATGVEPGMAVADIGAGTGLFTRLFAQQVGDSGTVYAVDISADFIDNIVRISRARGQFNVRGVVNSSAGIELPPASIDIAFVCDTYHHFEDPAAMLASIRRALKPGGRLTVIDFRKRPGISTAWVMGHVRAGREQVIEEIEAAGFRRVDTDDFLEENYLVQFVPVEGQTSRQLHD